MKTTSRYNYKEKKLIKEYGINIKTCSLCGKEYIGFGHNAFPLRKERCCDQCNILVMLARLKEIKEEMKNASKH